ncbi:MULTISPECIES: hypothetical protein [unclassified Aureimonas]|uniref:hypothetical protein n=1 Tax=unclassified Aureimonas TaxID=2615206 RepID=UPI000AE9505B|nr:MULTISPECIES: hypothetical protein [unclassified Aureimonas]
MTEAKARMAAYIAQEAAALVEIARKGNAPMLAYLAGMLAAEAAELVKRRKP